MSDEQQDLNLEDVGATGEEVAGPRRAGLLSGMLLTVLKWAAIGIGAIIIVVTTTVITFRVLNRGNTQAGLAALSPAYSTKSEPLATYDGIDQIRGYTADDPPAYFVLQVSLGYDVNDKVISTEIGNRRRQIQDLILKDVGQKTEAELGASHWGELQAELLQMINMIMRDGKVQSVMFQNFLVTK